MPRSSKDRANRTCRMRRADRRLVWALLPAPCSPWRSASCCREGSALLFALVAAIVIGLLVALPPAKVEKP